MIILMLEELMQALLSTVTEKSISNSQDYEPNM